MPLRGLIPRAYVSHRLSARVPILFCHGIDAQADAVADVQFGCPPPSCLYLLQQHTYPRALASSYNTGTHPKHLQSATALLTPRGHPSQP